MFFDDSIWHWDNYYYGRSDDFEMWMTLQWPIVNKLVLSHLIQNKCYIICMVVINNNILLLCSNIVRHCNSGIIKW